MTIKMTVDRIEGEKVILITTAGKTVIWPKDDLPVNLHEGMVLIFEISGQEEYEKKDKQKAKDILNEILHINP